MLIIAFFMIFKHKKVHDGVKELDDAWKDLIIIL